MVLDRRGNDSKARCKLAWITHRVQKVVQSQHSLVSLSVLKTRGCDKAYHVRNPVVPPEIILDSSCVVMRCQSLAGACESMLPQK